MAAISQLFVEFRASLDKFHDDLAGVSKEVRQFDKDLKPVTERVKEFGDFATKAGKALTLGVTAPIAAIAGVGIAFNAMQEQAQIGFTTMLGSGERAKQFLENLKTFAAKTPFEFAGLVHASQRLLAMGFAVETIMPTLSAVGNAVAGLGGGAPEIDRVTLALGQMQGRGRVATQEMNQLTEVGIPAWRILADNFGVSEMALRSMVEKGVVPADKAVQALVNGMNERFPNMNEKQSRSFKGLMSTIKDELQFLSGDLSEGLFNALKGPTAAFAGILGDMRLAVDGWGDGMKAAIGVAALMAASVGPLLLTIGELTLAFNQLVIFGGHLSILLGKLGISLTAASAAAAASVAGVVALGAAVGVAIGMFANWILRVTGLQESFDRLLARAVSYVPILGPWANATNAVTTATQGLSDAQKRLVTEFAKHGVAVDAARLNDSAYLASLAQMSKQWTQGAQAVNVSAKAHDAMTQAAKLAFPPVEKLTAEMKKQQKEALELQTSINLLGMAYAKAAPTMPMPIVTDIDAALLAASTGIDEIPLQRVGLPVTMPDVPRSVNETIEAHQKQWEAWRLSGQRAIDQVVGDMSRMFVDSITHGKNFWEAFKNVGRNAIASVIDTLMSRMLHSFLDPFATALGRALDGLTRGLKNTLAGWGGKLAGSLIGGSGGSVAQTAAQTATGAAGAASSGASAAGQIAGGLASGGVIGAAVSAIGSIGTIMQLKRIEGTMNAVEYNTRASEHHLFSMIEQLMWPSLPHILPIRQILQEQVNQLDAIFNAIMGTAAVQAPAAPQAATAAGGTQNLNVVINVQGVQNARQFAEELDSILQTGEGGFRERWTLFFSQSAGIVSTVPAG